MSLTIYMFQILDILPREIVTFLFDVNFRDKNQASLLWAVLMTIIVIIMWDILIRLWEKVNFFGSWEWVLMKIRVFAFPRTAKIKRSLETKNSLYDVEIIQFVDSVN